MIIRHSAIWFGIGISSMLLGLDIIDPIQAIGILLVLIGLSLRPKLH